jgi:hypothetical protein
MEGISNFPTWDMEDVNVLYEKGVKCRFSFIAVNINLFHCSIYFHNKNNHYHHCTRILMMCKLLQCHSYNNNISNCYGKHKSYKNLVSMLIHGDLTLKV